jgi:16S rRNA (cytosine967-C5)-methyltransferase
MRPLGATPLDPELQQVLRVGVYELLELGLPDHAISQHVDVAKALVRPEASRVVNGGTSPP